MANSYLTRAVSSSGNQKTYTVSAWCKIGSATGSKTIFSSDVEDDGANFTMSGTNGNFIFRPTVDMEVHADIVPDADLTRDLGEVANRFPNLRRDVLGKNWVGFPHQLLILDLDSLLRFDREMQVLPYFFHNPYG